jgi:hypothetical protein
MARFITGTGGFEYAYIVGSKAVDVSLMAKASGVGTLSFALDYLITFKEAPARELSWNDLAPEAAAAAAQDGGRYEAPSGEDPWSAFDGACLAEQARVPAILSLLSAAPARIELRGRAQFRLDAHEWGRMVDWLNTFLPAELKLTLDALRSFDLAALERFNPDEGSDDDKSGGTRCAAFLCAANADRYLPYLGLRILTHAVQRDLASMTVEETDRLWRGTVWEAPLPRPA